MYKENRLEIEESFNSEQRIIFFRNIIKIHDLVKFDLIDLIMKDLGREV